MVISMVKPNLQKIVWVPRAFSVLFAIVLFFLTADTFTELSGFLWPAVGCGAIIAVVAVTWNKPKFTGIFFLIFAVGFLVDLLVEKKPFEFTAYSFMSGIPAIIGILFLTFGENKSKKATIPEVKVEPTTQVETEVKPE